MKTVMLQLPLPYWIGDGNGKNLSAVKRNKSYLKSELITRKPKYLSAFTSWKVPKILLHIYYSYATWKRLKVSSSKPQYWYIDTQWKLRNCCTVRATIPTQSKKTSAGSKLMSYYQRTISGVTEVASYSFINTKQYGYTIWAYIQGARYSVQLVQRMHELHTTTR